MRFLLDHDVPDRRAGVIVQAGHGVVRLREVLPPDAADRTVLEYAHQQALVLVTCNRDDFLDLARERAHSGIVFLVRRKSRVAECAAFLRLLDQAGPPGIERNVTFA